MSGTSRSTSSTYTSLLAEGSFFVVVVATISSPSAQSSFSEDKKRKNVLVHGAEGEEMGPVRIRHTSHDFGWQFRHSVDLAGWQAKMASIEIWIPWGNAHKPHCAITTQQERTCSFFLLSLFSLTSQPVTVLALKWFHNKMAHRPIWSSWWSVSHFVIGDFWL